MISRLLAASVLVSMSLLGLSPSIVNAGVVTSLPGGDVVPFPTSNQFTMGPKAVTPDITWTSTTGSSVFGWNQNYGFGSNGNWNNNNTNQFVMVGLNAPAGTMTLEFANPVAGVAGLLNYNVPATGNSPASIAVYDSAKTLLESYDLTFLVSGDNEGQFLGFLESTADIKYFTLSNQFVGLTDFTVLAQAPPPSGVPEPGTLALLGAALAGIGMRRRSLR